MTDVHTAIAADLYGFGGILRCTACETERPLRDVAGKLRNGWPKCCGYTMTWVTQRLLDEERAGPPPAGTAREDEGHGTAD